MLGVIVVGLLIMYAISAGFLYFVSEGDLNISPSALRRMLKRRMGTKAPLWLQEYDLEPEALADLYNYEQISMMCHTLTTYACRSETTETAAGKRILANLEDAKAVHKLREATKRRP